MSGLRVISSRNLSCFFRSTLMSLARIPVPALTLLHAPPIRPTCMVEEDRQARVQLPCHFMDTALACLSSSSTIRSSSWTRLRRPLALVSFHLALVMTPKPSLPWLAAPTMSLWRSLASASAAALPADHFRPVWTVMSAWRTFWSLLSRHITCRALATLNCSITDVLGSCSLLQRLYGQIEEKLLGTDSHLRKKDLILFSNASPVVTGTSYMSNGQRSLGSTPCW